MIVRRILEEWPTLAVRLARVDIDMHPAVRVAVLSVEDVVGVLLDVEPDDALVALCKDLVAACAVYIDAIDASVAPRGERVAAAPGEDDDECDEPA